MKIFYKKENGKNKQYWEKKIYINKNVVPSIGIIVKYLKCMLQKTNECDF